MVNFNPNQFLPNRPFSVLVLDNTGNVILKEVYQINPKHRDGSLYKSQWTIKNQEEAAVFGWALEHDSHSGKYYWGVFLNRGVCRVLGQTAKRQDSKIARFECSSQPRIWHGYPVDYVNNPQNNCPHRTVLYKWVNLSIITKSQISKLLGGMGWKD